MIISPDTFDSLFLLADIVILESQCLNVVIVSRMNGSFHKILYSTSRNGCVEVLYRYFDFKLATWQIWVRIIAILYYLLC